MNDKLFFKISILTETPSLNDISTNSFKSYLTGLLILIQTFFNFQSLQTEIENHEPRIMSVVDVGQELIDEEHPQSEEFKALIEDLLKYWQDLKDAVGRRHDRIHLSDIAQQVSYMID